jgi:hypothetical protein
MPIPDHELKTYARKKVPIYTFSGKYVFYDLNGLRYAMVLLIQPASSWHLLRQAYLDQRPPRGREIMLYTLLL